MNDFVSFSNEYKPIIDDAIQSFLTERVKSDYLLESMLYSVNSGGKKFRALLLLATVDFLGNTIDKGIVDTASALEMVHTYSLIHDDLPAMDDDDLRRGNPTNHIVYGEAMAILAGDGLLTEAFHLLSTTRLESGVQLELIRLLAKSAGAQGMIAGQVDDILGEGKKISLKELQDMHRKKTGELIQFAVEAGMVLSANYLTSRKWLTAYAQNIGIAFQIRDDLLDIVGDEQSLGKKIGQDVIHEKNTYVSLLGEEGARSAFERHCDLAESSLNKAKEELDKVDETTLLDGILNELKVI